MVALDTWPSVTFSKTKASKSSKWVRYVCEERLAEEIHRFMNPVFTFENDDCPICFKNDILCKCYSKHKE